MPLHPGDLVVMDNLSSHKAASAVEAIEAVGAEVVYLPPCSPDLNPIENIFSKDDLIATYLHCGYTLMNLTTEDQPPLGRQLRR